MKNVSKLVGAVSGVCLLAISAGAIPLTVTQNYQYNGGVGGGEFTVSGTPWAGNYAAVATLGGGFQTFCLEHNEGSPNIAYGLVNTEAVNGGTTAYGGPNPDPISRATAWLYAKFAAGTLAGYDYTPTFNPGTQRKQSAAELQSAIWFLENETGAAGLGAGFVALALANVSNPYADANGAFGVFALNMYGQDGSLKQDMLVRIPDGGLTLGMLGLGLLGLGMARRKQLVVA